MTLSVSARPVFRAHLILLQGGFVTNDNKTLTSQAIDVDNGDYHSLSQFEIDGGIEIYQQVSRTTVLICFDRRK